MTNPIPTTALELLARLEEGYRRHAVVHDLRVLSGNPRAVATLEEYELIELGMRIAIADARHALGLPNEEWLR